MIDTEALRKKVIDLAIQGKLTQQLPEDGNAEDLYAQIQDEKAKLVKEGKIKKLKTLPVSTEDAIPFEIPNNWKWIRLGSVCNEMLVPQRDKPKLFDGDIPWCRIDDIEGKYLNGTKSNQFVSRETIESMNLRVNPVGTVISACSASIGAAAICTVECVTNQTFIGLVCSEGLYNEYLYYFLKASIKSLKHLGTGMTISYISQDKYRDLLLPLPPLAEQKRIVNRIEEICVHIDIINTLQQQYESDLEVLKRKIIDAGIRGKLTEQLQEDGNAETLYTEILVEKANLVKAGKIKKEKPLPEISDDEIPFEIPNNWKWVRFGATTFIERGGSPRPIKSYITDSEDGINWIKIGDVEKGGKYIYSTKEKIIPEGEKKSRHVYPGDFLLTNSMSFGRPYISKVEGCIHDGWLLIRDLNGFSADYLYLLLSSSYMYGQFCNKASGATVDNLNIDKVNSALIPLPPLKEQKRIATTIEAILEKIS